MIAFIYASGQRYHFPEATALQPKSHDFAIEQDRAYNSDQWQIFGDGKENPSPQDVEVYLSGATRIDAAMRLGVLQNSLATANTLLWDVLKLPVCTARVIEQQPVGDAGYKLKIRFYPSQALWVHTQTGQLIPLL